jgi:hypothetical protein
MKNIICVAVIIGLLSILVVGVAQGSSNVGLPKCGAICFAEGCSGSVMCSCDLNPIVQSNCQAWCDHQAPCWLR